METKSVAAQMLKNKDQKWYISKDEKSLTIYSKLLEYYDLFKNRFGEANFTRLSVKTGLTKNKVKSYLRGTRKMLDVGEIGMIMFYLTNYDHNYKSRSKVNREKKAKNKSILSEMKSSYCGDEKNCECENCVKNDVKKYDGGLKFFGIVIACVMIFVVLLFVLFVLRARYA